MNYITDFHWIWYGLGFIFCPQLTIMIMLSIHFGDLIPLPLMIIGWIYAVCRLCNIKKSNLISITGEK